MMAHPLPCKHQFIGEMGFCPQCNTFVGKNPPQPTSFPLDLNRVLAERGASYGDFTDQGAIAQSLKDVVRQFPGWKRMAPHQREAIDMILHKLSRAINGDPNFADTWVDIAGYAQITADRCPKP